MPLDAALGPLGDLQFGEGGQEPRGRPGLPVGPLGELGPQPGDGGQAQLAQQQRQAGGVDGEGAAHHAPPPVSSVS